MRRELFLLLCALFLFIGNLISAYLLTPKSIPFILILIIIAIILSRYIKVTFLAIFLLLGALGKQYSVFERIFPENRDRNISEILLEERERFSDYIDNLYHGRDDNSIAIIKALSIGSKEQIDDQTWENFRKSGTLHLLALSGMHLGIIYQMLHYLLAIMGNFPLARKIKSIIIITSIWLYTIFTGAGVSLLRASIMATVYEFATLIEREKNGINALSISAIVIILIWPEAPLGAGFQLSFGAMMGIFLIYPHLAKLSTPKNFIVRHILRITLFSVSCTIFTTPLLLFRFNTYALFSMLTNLLCTPLITVSMGLIPISIASSVIVPQLNGLINFLLFKTIEIFSFINHVLGNI